MKLKDIIDKIPKIGDLEVDGIGRSSRDGQLNISCNCTISELELNAMIQHCLFKERGGNGK